MGVLTTVAKKSSGQNSLTSATWSTAFGALVGFSTRWYTRKIEMGEFPWLGQKFALIDIQINNYSILGRTTELKLLVVKLTSFSPRLNGWKDSQRRPCVAFRSLFQIPSHFYFKWIFRSTAPLPYVLRTCGFVILPSKYQKLVEWGEVYARWVGLKLQTKLRISNPTWKSRIEILSATLNTKKEQLLQRIQLIDTEEEKGRISDMQRAERIKAKDKFQEVALPEEIKWRQKSRINWLRHGDCNAKFFHTFANGRRSKSKSLLLLLMVPNPTTFKGLKMRLLPSTSTFVLLW